MIGTPSKKGGLFKKKEPEESNGSPAKVEVKVEVKNSSSSKSHRQVAEKRKVENGDEATPAKVARSEKSSSASDSKVRALIYL